MRDFVVNASVIFTEGFEYILANGVIIKYEDGYLCDRDGNRISTYDCPVLPMINYHPQVKAGEYTSSFPSAEDQYENVMGNSIESEEVLDKLKYLRNDDQKRIMDLLEENMELSVENAKLKEDLESRPKVVETENFKRIGDWLIPKGYDEAFNVCKIHRIFKSDNPNEVWISTNDDSYAVTGAVEELLQVLA